MPCESYKQALSEAAATSEALSRELTAHLNTCPACRMAFAEEQQLFAAIDSGLRAVVNTPVPASLVPRVRIGVNEQPVPGFAWTKVGAVLAAGALVVAAAVFLRGPRSERHETASVVATSKPSPAPKETARPVAPAAPERPEAALVRPRRNLSQFARGGAADAQVSVIVPPGQKQTVDAWLMALSSGTVQPESLPAEKTAEVNASGEFTPLGIPEIQIKPLAPVSVESAPTR